MEILLDHFSKVLNTFLHGAPTFRERQISVAATKRVVQAEKRRNTF